MPDPDSIHRLLIVLVALLATSLSAPLWERMLQGAGWIDLPRPDRHNPRPVSRSGGVAWLTGALVGMIIAAAGKGSWAASATLVAALLVAFALGRADDLGRLPIGWKWGTRTLLLLAATILIVQFEQADPSLPRPVPLGGGASIHPAAATWAIRVVAIAAALWLQTALEIFDNLDGALATVSAAGFAALALAPGPPWLAGAAVAGCGASIGLLSWNRPPAQLFLGNAGSSSIALLLPLLLAVSSWNAVERPPHGGWILPAVLLPLAWPMFDLLFVTVTRGRRGEPPWRGGRDHTTHRLSRRLGSDRAAFVVIAVSTGLALALAVRWMTLEAHGSWPR